MTSYREGYVDVMGVKLYFRVSGEGGKTKLICLHGGPGGSCDYLSPLLRLSESGLEVLLYDQFGCGRSSDPANDSCYTVEYGVEEVEGVRKAFYGDEKVVLLGHSYGGLLAIAYALNYQHNLKALIVSSGLSSVPLTVIEMRRLISEMPPQLRDAIEKHEARGEFTHPEYLRAVDEFYKKHLLRLPETPPDVARTMEFLQKRRVYSVMNGPNEFTIIGTIRDWDVTSRLGEIRVPTLITVGKYDEVTPNVAEVIHSGIPNSKLKLFENSSHMAMWEEPEEYLNTIKKFIEEIG
ncbi:MAG: proline iminopeptidase-family hydrolase [Thermoprotei archaeon]